ncbi:MAG: 1-acyl-sn-glycerol-3-phosphate acyltransferase [Xanthomonadales bacterium]|nr:1-acyl-sn-glycerol-3-phosphate acyltransferase [Xanthomonadales bacterium]
MRSILFWPYQLYAWLIFVPLVSLLTLIFSALTIVSAALINPHFASRVFAVTWARLAAFLTPIRVDVEGAENAQRQRSYIVASNHQSQYDILVIYGWLKLDLKWVMKKELRKIPGIGIGCEKAGHIFVERRNPKKAAQVINEALERLGDGIGILFFPEGTRSPDGRLLPFKKGAFRTAIDSQFPLLPVTVVGTRDILPARSLALFPGRARLVIHPPIETTGKTVEDLDGLMAEAREVINSALPGELR